MEKILSLLPNKKSPVLWFVIILLVIAGLTAVSPAEQTLGTNARIVYLHGAWVWAALGTLVIAGSLGLAGLLTRRMGFHNWSRALGRTGLIFWITYLPLSLWSMQANWNGLFLAEPRWRVALIFAIGGLLLQIGITLINRPAWSSAVNVFYITVLFVVLQSTANVMHPPGPMRDSNVSNIQLFFSGLTILSVMAAWQMARWWHRFEGERLKDRG